MHIRGRVLTPWVVGAVVTASMSIAPVSAHAQSGQKAPAKPEVKLTKVQEMELKAAFGVIDAVKRGTPVPTGYKMTLQTDTMKGFNNKTYVAFTVYIDPEGVAQKNVTGYLRVVKTADEIVTEPKIDPNDPKAAEKAKAEAKAKADTKAPPIQPAWQDFFATEIKASEPGQPFRLARSFTVPAGDYNVYLSLRDQADPKAKEKDIAAAKAGVLKQAVVVPDYWNNELNTSTIVVTDTMINLTAPLSPEEQPAHPYTFGMAELKPLQEPKLSKKAELTAWFYVYNPAADANRKPNVLIEYKFYQKVATAENGEKYFNSTKPVELNAQTLPEHFDMAAGHQLPGGLAVPLASFPEGVYRLEIKVTDKISGKSIVKDATFTVTP